MQLFRHIVTVLAVGLLVSSGQADEPLVIQVGVISPLSGTSAYFGIAQANGVILALEEAQIPNVVITYIKRDDKGIASNAAEVVDELAAEGCAAIIGPMDSHSTAAALKAAARHKIPLISPAATASYLTTDVNRWFFRAITSDAQRAVDLVDWMIEQHPTGGLLVVHETRSISNASASEPILYGESAGKDVRGLLVTRQHPHAVVEFVRDNFDASASAVIEKIANANVVGTAILGRSTDTKAVAELIRSRRPSMAIYLMSPGKNMFKDSQLKDNVYAVTDTIIENTNAPALVRFRQRYLVKFDDDHDPIDQYATFGYDAGMIVLGSITRAVGDAARLDTLQEIGVLRDAIREQIASTPHDRQGLMSTGGFTDRNELNFRPHRQQLVAGVWKEVGAMQAAIGNSGFNAAVAVTLFVALMLATALLIWQLPRLSTYGEGAPAFIVYVLISIFPAVCTFSLMRSYGSISGERFGVAMEFGGPAALFLLVLSIAMRRERGRRAPFSVTIRLHDKPNQQGIIHANGTITLFFPEELRSYDVTNGQAVLAAIDAGHRNTSVDYKIDIKGYRVPSTSPQIRLSPGQIVYIRVSADRASPG